MSLEDAISKRMGLAEPPSDQAEHDAATDAAIIDGLAELVDDPFVPGSKVRPSLARTAPLNRFGVAFRSRVEREAAGRDLASAEASLKRAEAHLSGIEKGVLAHSASVDDLVAADDAVTAKRKALDEAKKRAARAEPKGAA